MAEHNKLWVKGKYNQEPYEIYGNPRITDEERINANIIRDALYNLSPYHSTTAYLEDYNMDETDYGGGWVFDTGKHKDGTVSYYTPYEELLRRYAEETREEDESNLYPDYRAAGVSEDSIRDAKGWYEQQKLAEWARNLVAKQDLMD